MKQLSTVYFSCLLAVALLFGCQPGESSSSSAASPEGSSQADISQEEESPSSPPASVPPVAEADIPPETALAAFEVPLQDEAGAPTGESLAVSLYLPTAWSAEGLAFMKDGTKMAELLYTRPASDAVFEDISARYADATATAEVTAGLYAGQYYHMQEEMSEGGMTALQNQLFYVLQADEQLLFLGFYPRYGIGIGTQREEFETYLSTLRIQG